jgi:hypothetical protein
MGQRPLGLAKAVVPEVLDACSGRQVLADEDLSRA